MVNIGMFDPALARTCGWIAFAAFIVLWIGILFHSAGSADYAFLGKPSFYGGIPFGGVFYGFVYAMTWPFLLIAAVAAVLILLGILFWKVISPYAIWEPFASLSSARPILELLGQLNGKPPRQGQPKTLRVDVASLLGHGLWGFLTGLFVFGGILWIVNGIPNLWG
jgi:hypothetical protein